MAKRHFNNQKDWTEYCYTMKDYIGGQISCEFVISGVEQQMEDITELYFMTKADKV